MVLDKKAVYGPKPIGNGAYTQQKHGRMENQSTKLTTLNVSGGSYQPSNTKLKYDRIKLRSRQQKQKQVTAAGGSQGTVTTSARSLLLSNSNQALVNNDFVEVDDVDDFEDDDDMMMYESGGASIKNAKSLGYLTASSVSNGGRTSGGRASGSVGRTGDEYADRMRRSLSNYTYLNGASNGGYFQRDSSCGSRHSLKPLSTSNGSLNSNWYKPKSLQLPPPCSSTTGSSNLESALNAPLTSSTSLATTKTGMLKYLFIFH